MTKDEQIQHLKDNKKSNYSFAEVMHMINNISYKIFNFNNSSELKKGDVINIQFGYKLRPGVIIGFSNDLVFTIPLSTTEDALNLMETKDRIFGGWFGNGMSSMPIEEAKKNFIGVFQNRRQLNKAIKEVQKLIINF